MITEDQNKIRNEFFLETGNKCYSGSILDGDKVIWKEDYVKWLENKCVYSNQFKVKWNTFTTDSSLDPKEGELVLIVSVDGPVLIRWGMTIGVIEGDMWVYLKDLLPNQ